MTGYEAIRTAGLALTGTHEAISVEGRDASRFLNNLLTQEIEGLAEGEGARSLLLSPQGKLRALLWVGRLGEGLTLVTDAGYGERVIEDLLHYRVREKVELSAPRPVAMLVGPTASPPPGSLPAHLPDLPRWFTPETEGDPAGDAWTAVRVEEGEPVMGRDVDETTIPQETGLVPAAVSFAKGCYLGQELVARIDSRGHVNRRLVAVAVEGGSPPEGAIIRTAERDVGRITSVTRSPRLSATAGLSLLRREAGPGPGITVGDDGLTGRVFELPLSPHKSLTKS
jgi:folate-binding protein YgfZ